MTADALMMLGRLIGESHILAAAKHNKRTMYTGGISGSDIDATRSRLNYSLAGPDTPDQIVKLWKKLRADVGISKRRRKDEVSAIEIIFSLSADTRIDLREYFMACTTWVTDQFGGANNILASDVHLDEPAPHCHVIVTPLVSGKMKGSDLYWGGSKNHEAQHASFHASVGLHYGLRKQQAKQRASKSAKEAQAGQVWETLRALPSDAHRWAASVGAVDHCIGRDATPFMVALGLTPRVRAKKTFKEIALSTGAGPKTEAAEARKDANFATGTEPDKRKPIGFDGPSQASTGPSGDRTLSCVGFGQFVPSSSSSPEPSELGEARRPVVPWQAQRTHAGIPAHAAPCRDHLEPGQEQEYTRYRDADLDPADFDPDRGEHITRQVRTQSAKAAAMAWVSGGLPTRPDAAAPQAAR